MEKFFTENLQRALIRKLDKKIAKIETKNAKKQQVSVDNYGILPVNYL